MIETENDQLTFAKAEAKPMPTLVCVGNVTEVEDGYISEKTENNYAVIPIVIDPLEAGKRTKVYFTFRPEWLHPDFRPRSLQRTPDDRGGAYFVYSKNISSAEEKSLLRSLAGSDEAFANLSNELLRLATSPEGPTIDEVTEVLRNFFANNVGQDGNLVRVGYEMRQQRVDTGEIDAETGKKIYALEKRYNCAAYWDVTDREVKRQTNRANNSNGLTVMTYSGAAF